MSQRTSRKGARRSPTVELLTAPRAGVHRKGSTVEAAKKSDKLVENAGKDFVYLDISGIQISERFNRTTIDEKDPEFGGLVESIKELGVLEPILVRRITKGKAPFELIAGERRLRACKRLRMHSIPAMVNDVTEGDAAEVQFSENYHRKDLAPFEEAQQLQGMLKSGKKSAQIALELGVSQRFVQRRASVANLSPKWVAALRSEKTNVRNWPAMCLEEIAKLQDHAAQDKVHASMSQYGGLPHIAYHDRVKQEVVNLVMDLKHASWQLDDEVNFKRVGACTSCQKRSKANPLLWGQKANYCLDRGCWMSKQKTHAKAVLDKAKANHPKAIPLHAGYGSGPNGEASERSFKPCKSTTSGAVPAVVVDGTSKAKVKFVKPISHAGQMALKPKTKPMAERRRDLNKKRNKKVANVVRQKLNDAGPEVLGNTKQALNTILAIAATWGCNADYMISRPEKWQKLRKLQDKGAGVGLKQLWANAKSTLLERICSNHVDLFNGDDKNDLDNTKPIAVLIGEDVVALKKAAEKEIPEPKSWAGLNANGTPKKAKAKPKAKAESFEQKTKKTLKAMDKQAAAVKASIEKRAAKPKKPVALDKKALTKQVGKMIKNARKANKAAKKPAAKKTRKPAKGAHK